MLELILVMETRPSNQSDYMYIKSVLDYFYEPRTFGISKIFANTKSLLTKQEPKIANICKHLTRTPVVILFADYDRDEELNNQIIKYCNDMKYELVWMNENIERVFLNRNINSKEKRQCAINFQKQKNIILPTLQNLDTANPIEYSCSSNILCVMDKYLKRI